MTYDTSGTYDRKTWGDTSPEGFQRDPRSYAVAMTEGGLVSAETMLLYCLKYMSHDDVRGMLDANELSPRFDEEDEGDDE